MMSNKSKKIFVCSKCDAQLPKWSGQCLECGGWGTLRESELKTQNSKLKTSQSLGEAGEVMKFEEVKSENYPRIKTSIEEIDRVLGGGFVPGSLILLSGEPGIGKCLVGSTRILDPFSGAFLPITEWANKHRPVLSMDETTYHFSPQQPVTFLDQGVQPVVLVKTRLGRTLRCTSKHPVFTPDGWQSVGNLQSGARIAAPRALPYFGKDAMPEHQVKLIAYILSDGSATSQITVTSVILEIQNDLVDIAQKFDLQLRVYLKRDTVAKQFRFVQPYSQRAEARKKIVVALKRIQAQSGLTWAGWARQAGVNYGLLNCWRRGKTVPSVENLEQLAKAACVSIETLMPEARDQAEMRSSVARFLESIGLRFLKARTKFIPNCIFCLPREQMALFLKVLFSCDGSVFINRDKQPGISYSTISQRLAQDVQHLLLRFGFVAKLRTKLSRFNDLPYIAYEIQLLGVAEVKRFLSEVGIWGREKAKAQIAKLPMPRFPSTQSDTIPTGIEFWEHLREITGGLSFKQISAITGVTMHYHRENRPLARSTVVALANAYPSFRWKMMAKGEIYWDEIQSIASAGKDHVYDLSLSTHANFIANDLIVHNSTLVAQIASQLIISNSITNNSVLYVSGEESAEQIKMRIDRLNLKTKNLNFLGETNVENICATIIKEKPSFVIIDSIQTLNSSSANSEAGSVAQVRNSTVRLLEVAKQEKIPILIIAHITKDGSISGPKTLEHLVDAVLYLEGDPYHQYRLLRSIKNRFGSTNEVGVFEMSGQGLIEVKNPSEAFLSQKEEKNPGSAIAAIMAGGRSFLVEVQALVAQTHFGYPQRRVVNVDYNRAQLLIAVLSRRLGLPLGNFDIHLNIVGGIEVKEPALDLAMAMAIVSAYKNKPLINGLAVFGEIGLAGEIRRVNQEEQRINEAKKLGFNKIIKPVSGAKQSDTKLKIIEVKNLKEAIAGAFEK